MKKRKRRKKGRATSKKGPKENVSVVSPPTTKNAPTLHVTTPSGVTSMLYGCVLPCGSSSMLRNMIVGSHMLSQHGVPGVLMYCPEQKRLQLLSGLGPSAAAVALATAAGALSIFSVACFFRLSARERERKKEKNKGRPFLPRESAREREKERKEERNKGKNLCRSSFAPRVDPAQEKVERDRERVVLLVERDETVQVDRDVHLGRPLGRLALPDEGRVDPVCRRSLCVRGGRGAGRKTARGDREFFGGKGGGRRKGGRGSKKRKARCAQRKRRSESERDGGGEKERERFWKRRRRREGER